MAYRSDKPVTSRVSLTERHLGLIAMIAGAFGMVAICGSPAAVVAYAEDLAGALWAAACAVIG